MNRRGFLGSILALGAAPAIVRADSLMKIVVPEPILPAGLQQFVVTEITGSGLSIAAITQEALRIAHSKSLFLFGGTMGIKPGDVITIEGVSRTADHIRIRAPYKRVAA